MMTRVCRWGILSTAVISRKNWQAIQQSGNGQVVAVASRSLKRSQEYIDQLQQQAPFGTAPRAYGSYDELLHDDQVDAVYIPLPTGLRKEWVIKAAQAGKHVVCEKPCAVSANDLLEMIAACEDHQVQFMDGVMFMHSHRYRELRNVIDDGTSIGDLKRIHCNFSFNAPQEFRSDNIRTTSKLEPQGSLGDLGWYCIRFALWARHYKLPISVCGRMLDDIKRDDSSEPVPMEFSAELIWDDGCSASFYTSFQTQMQQWAHLSGTCGTLQVPDFVLPYYGSQLEFTVNQAEFVMDGCDFRMENHDRCYTVAEHGNSDVQSQETNLFRNFSELVIAGEVDETWPHIALKTQQVLDACLASARQDSILVSVSEHAVA